MFSWFKQKKPDTSANEIKRHKQTTVLSSPKKQKRKHQKRDCNDASRLMALEDDNATSSASFATSTVRSINKSVMHSSVSHSMIASSSRFALSAFSYEINTDELDIAISKLRDIDLDIQSVWVVSRPITRESGAIEAFEHWAVKIYTELVLIDMDFYELNGFGSFGCQPICASWAELSDFLHYYVRQNERLIKKPWEIIVSVIPKKLNNNYYNDTSISTASPCNQEIDETDLVYLSSLMESDVSSIKTKKKVNDICDFLDDWSTTKQSYHSVLNNCQRFAFDLFFFLVGDEYPGKVEQLRQRLQSPYDQITTESSYAQKRLE